MARSKYYPLCDRFPEHHDLIVHLASENRIFKDIVRDYADSRKALSNWQASDHPIAPDRVDEYRRLLKELELEIKQFLHDAVKSMSP